MYRETNDNLRAKLADAMASTLLHTDTEVDAALLTEEGLALEEVDERMRCIERRARAENHPPSLQKEKPRQQVLARPDDQNGISD